MSEPHNIPANFTIPADCRHQWLFFSETIRASIWPEPPRSIRYAEARRNNEVSFQDERAVLDWMALSIEHLRGICSG
jgi:hypothetical protein